MVIKIDEVTLDGIKKNVAKIKEEISEKCKIIAEQANIIKSSQIRRSATTINISVSRFSEDIEKVSAPDQIKRLAMQMKENILEECNAILIEAKTKPEKPEINNAVNSIRSLIRKCYEEIELFIEKS